MEPEYEPKEEVIDFIRERYRMGVFFVKVKEDESPMTIDGLIWDIKAGTPYGKTLYGVEEFMYERELAKELANPLLNGPKSKVDSVYIRQDNRYVPCYRN